MTLEVSEMPMKTEQEFVETLIRWGNLAIAVEGILLVLKFGGFQQLARLNHQLGPLAPLFYLMGTLCLAATLQLVTRVPAGWETISLRWLHYATDACQITGVLCSFVAFSAMALSMDPGLSSKVMLKRVFESAAQAFTASATGLALALASHTVKSLFEGKAT